MDQQRKVAFAALIGSGSLGCLTFAADKLKWDFPPVLMYGLAFVAVIGLLISGVIWIHLAYESYVRRWGKSMIAQFALLLFGLFAVTSGCILAWKGGENAWQLWRLSGSAVAATDEAAVAKPTPRTAAPAVAQQKPHVPVGTIRVPPVAKKYSPPIVPNVRLAADEPIEKEKARRAGVLRQLTQLYMVSHDGISPRMMAFMELPPVEFLNVELKRLDEPWRVRDVNGARAEMYDVP